jgi:PKD repeat protein
MTQTHKSLTRTLSVLLAAAVALSVTAGFAGAAATTDLTVSITDDDNTVESGDTTTVEIAVANADGGVGAAELGVELSDPGVATITDVSVLHDPGSTDNAIVGGGQSADIKWAFADSPDTGSVTIVEVTLQAASPGSTDVDVVQNSNTGNLVVGDEDGAGYTLDTVGSSTLTVEAPAEDPVASFTFDPSSPEAGESVNFDASASTDADGSIESYAWDFDDDETASGATVSHAFDSAGDYEVELTVTDDSGAEDTITKTVSVQPESTDPGEGPSTEVHLEPADELLGVDKSTTFDIVVDSADGGVGAYSFTLELTNPSVGTIDDIELSGGDSLIEDVQIAQDGSSATVEAIASNTDDTGEVSIGTVTVTGTAEGTSDVSLTVDTLGTEAAEAYTVTGTTGASLEVSTLVVGDSTAPAQDLDDNGVYEDVNGDGSVDVNDVQTLFSARDGPTVTDNPEAFDFNDDGTFDLLDIQWLFYNEVA